MTPRHLLEPARLAGVPLLATQSDERLVDLFRAGSEPAFEAIVSRYRAPLLRYCSGVLGPERAEDAVQQAFVNAYDAMRGDERMLKLKPWLYRIAHNVSLNALRDRALQDEPLEAERPGAELTDRTAERHERLRSVLRSVNELPERQRDAMLLREVEGRSYEEIAAALGVGGGAVRQLLNRARNTLRTAVTAVTPVGLLLKLPPGGGEAGESVTARVAELAAGAGGGAVASKVAATALVTGAVAGGVAYGPAGDDARSRDQGRPAPISTPVPAAAGDAAGVDGLGDGSGQLLSDDDDRRGPGAGEGRDDRSGPGPGGGGDGHSGPGRSGGEDRSGPGGGGVEDTSGSSGSGSGSGSSGSGSSGSGSSGSGSSGSGSSGSGASGSGSGSGSSGSGSGSSSSGSGSSGSGSDVEPAVSDALESG